MHWQEAGAGPFTRDTTAGEKKGDSRRGGVSVVNFLYECSSMEHPTFRKNVFICWFQGEHHLDTLEPRKASIFKENVMKWNLLNPEWDVTLVSDEDLRQACAQVSKACLETYDAFDVMHLKIDLGRYALIYVHGGAYVDMDMYAYRGLDTSDRVQDLVKKSTYKHVFGLSRLNIDAYEAIAIVGRTRMINNAMMLSTAKNPIVLDLIQHVIANWKSNRHASSFAKIQKVTGPQFFNRFIYSYIDDPPQDIELTVFPPFVFEPSQAFGLSDIRNETIAIHKFEITWMPSAFKHAIKVYYTVKPYLLLIIILILVFIFRKHKIWKRLA
jgi:mannosyltransferase OCH1-like enzyme